jgi:hypothetical protein
MATSHGDGSHVQAAEPQHQLVVGGCVSKGERAAHVQRERKRLRTYTTPISALSHHYVPSRLRSCGARLPSIHQRAATMVFKRRTLVND